MKNLPINAGDPGSILELGRSAGEGSSEPLQYSCLEEATVYGATKNWALLNNLACKGWGDSS